MLKVCNALQVLTGPAMDIGKSGMMNSCHGHRINTRSGMHSIILFIVSFFVIISLSG